jgi:hypothetical protein
MSVPTVPCQVCHVSYDHATCHPYSGDTCHSLIGPPVLHVISSYTQSPCHMSVCMPSQHTEPTIVPFHVSCTTVRLVQSSSTWHCTDYIVIIFCLFGQINKPRYLEHMMFIWSHSSCVGFITLRHTHTPILKRFWALWFLGLSEPHLAPGSNFGSHLPTKDLLVLQKVTKWPFTNYILIRIKKTLCCTKMML